MNLLSKIILGLVTISIFIVLLLVTYKTNIISSIEKPDYKNIELGLFELNKNSENIFTIDKISKQDESTILVQRINISDKIFYSSGSLKIENEGEKTIISITPGIYIFDFNALNNNYIIKGEGFELNNQGPGTFIINSLSFKKNTIFSLNTILNLKLKNLATNEELTKIDLYPHTYLGFNLKYNQHNVYLKNADLLNISIKNTLGYYKEQIINKDVINEIFLNLILGKENTNKKIINNSLLFIKQEASTSRKNINIFSKYNFSFLPGENFIKDNYYLFINKNKKNIYYKNIILRQIYELLINEKNNTILINQIISNIKLLEKIDKSGYNEITNIIKFYYDSIVKSNQSIETKINFSKLQNKINNKKLNLYLKSLISLENTFFQYDYYEQSNFYNETTKFIDQYIEDLKINIEGKNINKGNINDLIKPDYLLFFIENILLTSDFSSSDINHLTKIFKNYVQISNYYYSYNNNNETKRIGLFTNSKILNKFIKILENKYFYPDRNIEGVLVLKENIITDKQNLKILETNINKIFIFYKENKYTLKENESNKDKVIQKIYSKIEKKYSEYFTALKDYNGYLAEYDKIKEKFLNTNTVNENEKDNKLILSKDNALKYLKTFNGINLKNININIMDYNYCLDPSTENEKKSVEIAYCYKIDNLYIQSKIDNLYIQSKKISFLLSPFEKNKINEIVINEKIISSSYKLDERKIILDEKIKTETIDREKYDFNNFFINTFGKTIVQEDNNPDNNTNTENNIIKDEDPVIKIFKRNKLLGESGDFAKLKGFLDIVYNNIIVSKIDNEFLININPGIINIDLGKNNKFYGEFISEYNFLNHNFINPQIKLIDEKNKKDLLISNFIYIIGEYKVNNIEEDIKKVFENYDKINYIVNASSQVLRKTQIDIKYIIETNLIKFEIPYLNNTIYLELQNGEIIKATYNKQEIINSKIPYTDISTIFNNI